MSHTILIVEDEAVSQKLATMLLEKAGYTVLLANNGIQALQCLAKNSISAILMDITMPGMDGIEAAVLIRDQEYGTDQHTPIIALTANAMKIDQDRVFEAGMDAYITKPFQIQELLETIELVIQKQQEKAIAPSPQPPQIQMPVATERPKELAIHGDVQIDNYFWLRERENLEVIRYLEDENSYTAARTAHTDALCKALYKEMRGRIQEEDLSVPEQIDSIYYYNRTAEGKQYVMHCRRRGSMQAAEEVILDENELAEEHDFLQIGDVALSPNHQLMAYLVNTDGGESYTLYVKDLERGTYLADRVSDLSYGLEWGNDNRTIFYVTHDEAMRPNKLFRHHLGDDPANDTLLHHETDDAFFLGVSKTK